MLTVNDKKQILKMIREERDFDRERIDALENQVYKNSRFKRFSNRLLRNFLSEKTLFIIIVPTLVDGGVCGSVDSATSYKLVL